MHLSCHILLVSDVPDSVYTELSVSLRYGFSFCVPMGMAALYWTFSLILLHSAFFRCGCHTQLPYPTNSWTRLSVLLDEHAVSEMIKGKAGKSKHSALAVSVICTMCSPNSSLLSDRTPKIFLQCGLSKKGNFSSKITFNLGYLPWLTTNLVASHPLFLTHGVWCLWFLVLPPNFPSPPLLPSYLGQY